MDWQAAFEREKHNVGRAVHEARAAEKVRQGFADHAWKPINRAAVMFSGAHYSANNLCAGDGNVVTLKRYGDQPDIELKDGTLCDIPKDRHHPDMLDYDDLAPHIQEYDIQTGIVGFRMGYEAAQRDQADDVA
jgi:hypothetical protein